ncbi:hypothetical protein LXA43DRAFT_1064025 [Ganoderma leucocontextum]|nr:hypothetical protein LXA43DRAFT_1064025 [Ganoderma leucocontextum]
MRFDTFEVCIASDDAPLPEHATVRSTEDCHGPKIMQTYIESEAGQVFTVTWRDYGGRNMFCVAVHMDGVLVEKHASPPGIIGRLRGVLNGGMTRLFKFSSIGDFNGNDAGIARGDEDFGTIQVTIAPIRAFKRVPAYTSVYLRALGILPGEAKPSGTGVSAGSHLKVSSGTTSLGKRSRSSFEGEDDPIQSEHFTTVVQTFPIG